MRMAKSELGTAAHRSLLRLQYRDSRSSDSGAGAFHTCGPTQGQVWCWGGSTGVELGAGLSAPSLVPVRALIPGGVTIAQVTVGTLTTCVLTTTNDAYCWGSNVGGQVGGKTVCFGGNDFGQVGDGTQTSRTSPVELTLTSGMRRVVARVSYSCRLTASDIDCWGDSRNGPVGTGLDAFEPDPVMLPGNSWLQVAENACARAAGNVVSCWGPVISATSGSTIPSSALTPIGGSPMREISGSGLMGCGLDAAGAAWCWGFNSVGLGDGSTTTSRAPVRVAGTRTYSSIDVGGSHACAIETGSGAVWCWGVNTQGALADDSNVNSATPVLVVQMPPALEVSAGLNFTCAVTTGRREVWCWGRGGKDSSAAPSPHRNFSSSRRRRFPVFLVRRVSRLDRHTLVRSSRPRSCAGG
jgi:hypothetical protein